MKVIQYSTPIILLALFMLMSSCCWREGSAPNFESRKNPLVPLGHLLFFDKRLSRNGTKSCASCHDPRLAFTDGYRRSIGATGDLHRRNSPSLLNISHQSSFTAGDPFLVSLSDQIAIPLFNTEFVEMGNSADDTSVLLALEHIAQYAELLTRLPSSPSHLTWQTVQEALASYLQTLDATDSRYDRFLRDPKRFPLTSAERRGRDLFYSKKLGCGNCHGGKYFNNGASGVRFFKNGFFDLSHRSSLDTLSPDYGVYHHTQNSADMGKFRVPSLRNVTKTAPYMHDGSVATLSEVIDIYSAGGIANAPKDEGIHQFELTPTEKRQLLLFFETLTDLSYQTAFFSQNPLFPSHHE
ncbi:MAG: hypothetical protein KDD60_06500 [Bdellovibrionales bacterium]|nr:hypothetical protein [Bdellovibrionales bacterium]